MSIEEMLAKCSNCGLCKSVCPVYKVLSEELRSPRGKINLNKNKINDISIYDCTLCNKCSKVCPAGLDLKDIFQFLRKDLVENKKEETEKNKKMSQKIEKYGNPFGEKQENEDEIYCC